jgi:hypothetical protein
MVAGSLWMPITIPTPTPVPHLAMMIYFLLRTCFLCVCQCCFIGWKGLAADYLLNSSLCLVKRGIFAFPVMGFVVCKPGHFVCTPHTPPYYCAQLSLQITSSGVHALLWLQNRCTVTWLQRSQFWLYSRCGFCISPLRFEVQCVM